MPIYSYECRTPDCEDRGTELVDLLQQTQNPPLCKTCGKLMVNVIATGAAPKFKGAGFHVNDYPSQNSIKIS